MKLTIANVSTTIQEADLEKVVAAIQRQVTEDFAPEWGSGATLSSEAITLKGKKAGVQRDADAIIYLGDSVDDPTTGVKDAYGYHSVNQKKIPYGFIYLDICEKYKEVWTCTLSHEVLELLGDPDAAMTVAGPKPKGAKGTVYYDLEVCDPTQGDTYKIDSVEVSNFVGKAYFGLSGGDGTTNYLKLPLKAFGVRPQGYFQYEEGSKAHTVQGERVIASQFAAKKLLGDYRRNRRREVRFGMTETGARK
jgi:hypothetical protein